MQMGTTQCAGCCLQLCRCTGGGGVTLLLLFLEHQLFSLMYTCVRKVCQKESSLAMWHQLTTVCVFATKDSMQARSTYKCIIINNDLSHHALLLLGQYGYLRK